MMPLFVTGAGTGVGKTYVTCELIRFFRAAGWEVQSIKPVISGFDPDGAEDSDTGRIIRALGREPTTEVVEEISPFRFCEPLSPDMAAAREGRRIDFDALVNFCEDAAHAPAQLIIEGVGGVMVPLDERHLVRDWIARLNCPALLVTGSYLGALNHCLTALLSLRQAGVPVAAIAVSESEDQPVPLRETVETLGRFADGVPVAGVTRGGDVAGLAAALALWAD